jgi:hypothetical protein
MTCRRIDGETCEKVIDSMKLLPKPGDNGYEDMVDFMRADLISGMALSKIIGMTRKQFEEQGKNFDEEFGKWKEERQHG